MKKNILLFILILSSSFGIFAEQPVLTKIGTYKCGRQPKQVLFSPDSKFVIMPLLDDDGFDIFSIEEKKIIKRINPPDSKEKGFAEGLFIPEKNVFLVSHMTTANLHEYSYPDFEYKRTIPTKGVWSKFIAYNDKKQILAVSNWVSSDISIIDYNTGDLIKQIKTGAAPRGIFFVNDGNSIISVSFDDGLIEKFDIESEERTKFIKIQNAAMRHIVLNRANTIAYVSDMYHRQVYKIDLMTFTIEDKVKVFNNPNTIDLLDYRWLFVSSRGPNNKWHYTNRSPENGKIQIIDTQTMEIVQVLEGGNQPTGLDVSNDGKYLCFSNFQDQNIELYQIEYDCLF